MLLNGFPVDKPPLFLYTLALFFRLFGPSEVVARLPGVLANTVSVALVYHLARRLYGRPTALAAAALMALSPFNILFAPTALTDPLLVALVLGALCLAVEGRWTGAGVMAGLAAATKQQGLLFLPLVVGVGIAATAAEAERVSENSLGSVIARSGATKQSLLESLRLLRSARNDTPKDMTTALPAVFQTRWRAYVLNEGPHFILGFLAAVVPAILWDLARSQRPGFLQQSALSYGGLAWAAPSQWLERGQRWGDLLWYVTASPPLNFLLVIGVPLLLLYGFLWRGRDRETLLDITITSFGLLFLALHLVLDFQVWDRYLLGLVPVVLLLLARVLWRAGDGLVALAAVGTTHLSSRFPSGFCSKRVRDPRLLGSEPPGHGPCESRIGEPLISTPLAIGERGSWRLTLQAIAMAVFLVAMLYRPAQDAANSRFPIGGDQGAYQGIETVADYFRGNVGAGATLYQRWLGWHLAFYMFNYPYDFQWYDSPQQLADHAAQATGPRYLVAPSWKSVTEEKVSLGEKGLSLHTVYRTYRHDGSVSFSVYRVEETGRE
jgi:hypothetical protein